MPVVTPLVLTWWSVGLTPAQSWISEARRSRDLRVGSRLLAWMMGRLLTHLQSQGAEILLPAVDEKALASLSGKFLEALKSGSTAVTNHVTVMTWFPIGFSASGPVQLKKSEGVFQYLHDDLGFDKSLTGNDLAS